MKLRDIGERRIIDDIIMSTFSTMIEQYDDCAIIEIDNTKLFFSTDPAPEPVAFRFGYRDYYYYGWLAVVVNLSDIAAMGGLPIAILVATVMNPEMDVHDYNRFLLGVKEACAQWECPLVGGNIKDGPSFTANGFVIGRSVGNVLTQSGACAGDLICVIGDMGMFWSSVITEHHGKKDALSDAERAALFCALTRPTAKIKEGLILAQSGYVTSCSDCSDGLTWNAIDMARKSRQDFLIHLSELVPNAVVERVCEANNYPVHNVMFAGGDYQLVCTVKPDGVNLLRQMLAASGSSVSVVGRVEEGVGQALFLQDSKYYSIRDIASERFNHSSIFSHGYEAYLHVLKNQSFLGEMIAR